LGADDVLPGGLLVGGVEGAAAVADGDPGAAAALVGGDVVGHEVGGDQHVVVDEDDHLAHGAGDAQVACLAGPEAAVLRVGVAGGAPAGEGAHALGRVVAGPVVADDAPGQRPPLVREATKQLREPLGTVVRGDDDGGFHAGTDGVTPS